MKLARAQADKSGKKHHFGRIFGICVGKHSEDPKLRRYKGRYVFDGSNGFDQNFNPAIFQELGSAPSSLEASKIVDWYGLWPGHICEQADAEQAYTQAMLDTTTTTWVIIPREYWPEG